MGQCFENEQLGMVEEAIKCYRRAAENGDREGILLFIAKSTCLTHVSFKSPLFNRQQQRSHLPSALNS